MAIEVVLLIPVLVAVLMLVVGFGRFADRQGDVDAAAREAARAASYERSQPAAYDVAQQAAERALPDGLACEAVSLAGTDFQAGGIVQVTVSCEVSFSELGWLGLPGSANLQGQSAAPLDEWRRTG